MIQIDVLEAILSRLERWKRRGYQIVACCPFHDDRNPSFYLDTERGIWHCFGCGEGGNLRKLVERLLPDIAGWLYTYKGESAEYLEAISFYESLPYLWEKMEIVSLVEERRAIKPEVLLKMRPRWGEPSVVSNYDGEKFKRFAGRIVFPNSFHKRLSSYLGYALNGEQPKYCYPPRLKPIVPFGWDEIWSEMRTSKQVYVVEGIFDMLSLWQIGLPAISVSGNTIRRLPALLPEDVHIILLPDNPKVEGKKGGLLLGVNWAVSCLLLGRWDAKLGVFPSYVYKDANEALKAGALEEQIERLELYPLPHFLIHVAATRRLPRLSVDFIVDLIARYVPTDYGLEVLRWVRRKYPSLVFKLHSAIWGYADMEAIGGKQEHWRIVFEAARSIEGRNLLREVFLEAEIPYVFSQEVMEDACSLPRSLVLEAAKFAAKQLRWRQARRYKSALVQLGFLPPDLD